MRKDKLPLTLFMTIKPGEVYWVDLGVQGKVRMMVVVSRQDHELMEKVGLIQGAAFQKIKDALRWCLDL